MAVRHANHARFIPTVSVTEPDMSYIRSFTLGAMLLALAGTSSLYAQISQEARPLSFETELQAPIVTVALEEALLAPRLQSFEAERAQPGPFSITRHGVEIPVSLGLDTAGSWTTLPDGRRLWRLRILSPGASSLNLLFEEFFLPEGARLFLYSDDQVHVLGAFTQQNNKVHGGFATDLTPGEAVTLEYEEPAAVAGQGRLQVATVVHGLSDTAHGGHATAETYEPASLPCSINTACPEGQGWEKESSAVVKVIMGGTACSGVLVNNVRQDGTPYVLTANHCGGVATGDVVDWVFAFNYESETCTNPQNTPSYTSVSGAVVRAAAGSGSDFTLLELLEPIPSSAQVHFAGWSIEDRTPTRGTVISHPRGDIKRIAVDDDPFIPAINFLYGLFDRGTIEIGSSGGPLFDENHRLVGLVRSAVTIDHDTCSGPDGDDNAAGVLFTKLAFNWDLGLSDYLDPDDTGATSIGHLSEPLEAVDLALKNKGKLLSEGLVAWTITVANNTEYYAFRDIEVREGSHEMAAAKHAITDWEVSHGTFNPHTGIWNIDDLDRHETATLVVVNALEASGVFTNCAEITRATPGFGVVSDCASVFHAGDHADPNFERGGGGSLNRGGQRFASDLDVELSTSDDAPTTGDEITITASVTNHGPQANGGVKLDLVFDDCLGVTGGAASHGRFAGGSWTIGTLHVGGTATLELPVTVGACDAEAEVTAEVMGNLPDPNDHPLNPFEEETTDDNKATLTLMVSRASAHLARLGAAYPNPFNPQTQFTLLVEQSQQVDVSIYDVTGRRVAHLYDGVLEAGVQRSFLFDGDGLPSGVYLIRAVGESFITTRTMTMLK